MDAMNNEMTKPPVHTLLDRLLPPLFRSLCREPNDLQIEFRHGSGGSSIYVRPSDDDFGLLMGSHAKTYRSFTTLCQAIGVKHGHRVSLDKLQGGRGRDEQRKQFPQIMPDPAFDIKPIFELLVKTVAAFTTKAQYDVQQELASYKILVTVAATEPAQNDLEIESALTTLFNAAAKLRGGDVRVGYCRSASAKLPAADTWTLQPATAAGRFAPEVK